MAEIRKLRAYISVEPTGNVFNTDNLVSLFKLGLINLLLFAVFRIIIAVAIYTIGFSTPSVCVLVVLFMACQLYAITFFQSIDGCYKLV